MSKLTYILVLMAVLAIVAARPQEASNTDDGSQVSVVNGENQVNVVDGDSQVHIVDGSEDVSSLLRS